MRRSQSFPANPHAVAAARRFVTGELADVPSSLLDPVELMVSELATNSVRHPQSSFEVTVVRTLEQIRIEVTDTGGGTPTMRDPQPTDPGGRGLRIVEILSEDWGIENAATVGKTVWFTVPATAA